ncbi:hypothetical protein [Micromonospora radicis]|uniref:hypothetical protein n=1 Tax=Micromonospora radicis TaxID=1894971 RepID=UPI0011C38644|nr:hypothetical protein [Micromonospora radicis]
MWDWDRTINEILGGGPNGPVDRLDVQSVNWIEHEATWRDSAYVKGAFRDLKPWRYNTEPNVIHFYRWVRTNMATVVDNVIVKVRINRDEYLPKWQQWSHGSYQAVRPLLEQRSHPVFDRQSFVDAANNFHLVEQWLLSTGAMVKQQMDNINTDASGFSGSAADAFHTNLNNLHRDLTDLHGDFTNKRLQGPSAWSTMLLQGADAIGEFSQEMRAAWYSKPNWIGPDGIIYGNWLTLPPQTGPDLMERTSERSVYQAVLNSLDGSWDSAKSVDGTPFGLTDWNVTFNFSLNADDPELIRTVDILHGDSWRTIDALAKLRWVKGIKTDLDKITETLVPNKLVPKLESISLRNPTGVQDLDVAGNENPNNLNLNNPPELNLGGAPPPLDLGGGGASPPPTLDGGGGFDPNSLAGSPPPALGGGGGIGEVNAPGVGFSGIGGINGPGGVGGIGGINGPGSGIGGINGPGGVGGIGGINGPGSGIGGINGPGGVGGIGGITGPGTGVGGINSPVPPPVRGIGGITSPGTGNNPSVIRPPGLGGVGASPGGIGSGSGTGVIGVGGPEAVGEEVIEQIGGLSATPYGGGLIGVAPDGIDSYQDLGKLSADTAAKDLAAKSADGSGLGLGGGYPFMPPMGGMGSPHGGKQQEDRERKTWLTEDEEVWGTDSGEATAVLGREPLPDADVEPEVRRPDAPVTSGSPYAPTRKEPTRATRGRV